MRQDYRPRQLEQIGLGLILLSLVPMAFAPEASLGGWLCTVFLASGILLGSLLLLLLTEIIPGRWQAVVKPHALTLSTLTTWLPVLAIPLFLGLPWLYSWYSNDQLTGFKAAYLSPVFFGLRVTAILISAAVLSIMLPRKASRPLAVIATIGFVLLDGLLATDLVQSLDPTFHSSGFGLYVLALQVLSGFAVIVLLGLRRPQPGDVSLMGGLFLTVLLLWPYFLFMQYFILWSGNLPSGAGWFARRGEGVWGLAEKLLAILRLLPPFLLLFAPIRASRLGLRAGAATTLFASAIETAWLILPEIRGSALLGFCCFAVGGAGLLLAAPLAHRVFDRRARKTEGRSS